MRRRTRYFAVGMIGAACILAGAVLPLHGRSPLGQSFFTAFPLAATGLILLAVTSGANLWRKALKLAAASAVAAFVLGYPFFSRYYYPDGQGSLYKESARRSEAIPGWACVEAGAFLVVAGCLGLTFHREKKEPSDS